MKIHKMESEYSRKTTCGREKYGYKVTRFDSNVTCKDCLRIIADLISRERYLANAAPAQTQSEQRPSSAEPQSSPEE